MELNKRMGGSKDFDAALLTNSLNGNAFNLGRGKNIEMQRAEGLEGAKGIFSSRERGGSFNLRQAGSGMSQAGQSIAGSQFSKFPSSTSRDAFNEE